MYSKTIAIVTALTITVASSNAESTIRGAPSNASPRATVDTPDALGDKIQTAFDNLDMLANYLREQQVADRLARYLNQIGAAPTEGQVHIFYVQVFLGATGEVDLKDFQYLGAGKTSADALVNSFTLENAPGTGEGNLIAVPPGKKQVGLYVTATPQGGAFAIRGMSLSKDEYQKAKTEGLALRDARAKARAEAQRIADLRAKHVAAQRAGDASAKAQLSRDLSRPLPRSGVEIEASDPTNGPVLSTPTLTIVPASSPSAVDTLSAPVAPPPIPFQEPVTPADHRGDGPFLTRD